MWLCSLKYPVWHLCWDGQWLHPVLSLSPRRWVCSVCLYCDNVNDRLQTCGVDTQSRMILMKTSTSQHLCASPDLAAASRSDHNLRLLLLPPHPLWFWLSTALLCAGAALTQPFANSSTDKESSPVHELTRSVHPEICSLFFFYGYTTLILASVQLVLALKTDFICF